MSPLPLSDAAMVVVCAGLGLLVGSFLNVVIARLPVMMERAWTAECQAWLADLGSAGGTAVADAPPLPGPPFNLSHPPSRCPQCAAPIRPWQNIPLLSWLWLRGRCAGCGTTISVRYPFVEALGMLLGAAVADSFGASWHTVLVLPLVWTLLALTFIDLDTFYLPDSLTLPLLWGGLLVNAQFGFVPLEAAVWGAAAGYGALWLICALFRMLTGREGMGAGDFKLLGALGAWLGWSALPGILLLSSLLGALCGGIAIAFHGQGRRTPIPFGPFLALAGLLALFRPGLWLT